MISAKLAYIETELEYYEVELDRFEATNDANGMRNALKAIQYLNRERERLERLQRRGEK